MVLALQPFPNNLTVESNIRRSARILVFNPQPWPSDPKIAYMHANISQIKTARIHYIFNVFKPRSVCRRALVEYDTGKHAHHFERSANQAHTCLGIFFFCDNFPGRLIGKYPTIIFVAVKFIWMRPFTAHYPIDNCFHQTQLLSPPL